MSLAIDQEQENKTKGRFIFKLSGPPDTTISSNPHEH